ncbi:hypothetical protein BJY52DRAFT_1354085 [Lactarius psammicola]|nr:hypothetical protein BJY52DRAFT_1354085 [Lactarius psammicola]
MDLRGALIFLSNTDLRGALIFLSYADLHGTLLAAYRATMAAAQEAYSDASTPHGGTVAESMRTPLKQNAHSNLFMNKKEEDWNESSKREEDASPLIDPLEPELSVVEEETGTPFGEAVRRCSPSLHFHKPNRWQILRFWIALRSFADGTHILRPHRHLLLSPADACFVPAHPSFRVITIGAPIPPYTGYPLDPPFRSRFQVRFLDPTSALLAYPHLSNSLSRASAALWTTLRDLVLATQYASEARHSLDGVARPALVPTYGAGEAARTARGVPSPITAGTGKASPLAARYGERLEEAGLGPLAAPLATKGLDNAETEAEHAAGLLGYAVRSIARTVQHTVRIVFAALSGADEIALEAPAGEGPLQFFPFEKTPDFVPISARTSFIRFITTACMRRADNDDDDDDSVTGNDGAARNVSDSGAGNDGAAYMRHAVNDDSVTGDEVQCATWTTRARTTGAHLDGSDTGDNAYMRRAINDDSVTGDDEVQCATWTTRARTTGAHLDGSDTGDNGAACTTWTIRTRATEAAQLRSSSSSPMLYIFSSPTLGAVDHLIGPASFSSNVTWLADNNTPVQWY